MSESLSSTQTLESTVLDSRHQAVQEYQQNLNAILDSMDRGESVPGGKQILLGAADELHKREVSASSSGNGASGSTETEYYQVSTDAKGERFEVTYPSALGARIEKFADAAQASSRAATSPADTQQTRPVTTHGGNGHASDSGRSATRGARPRPSRVPRTQVTDVERAHSMAIVEDQTITDFGITRKEYLKLKNGAPTAAEFHGKLAYLAQKRAESLKPSTLVSDVDQAYEQAHDEAEIIDTYGVTHDQYASLLKTTVDGTGKVDAKELVGKLNYLKAKHQGVQPASQETQTDQTVAETESKRRFARTRRAASYIGKSIMGRNRGASQTEEGVEEDAGLGILEPASNGSSARSSAAEAAQSSTDSPVKINGRKVRYNKADKASIAKNYGGISAKQYESLVSDMETDGDIKSFLEKLEWLREHPQPTDTSPTGIKAHFSNTWNSAKVFAANPYLLVESATEKSKRLSGRDKAVIGAAAVAAAVVGVTYLLTKDHSILDSATGHAQVPSGRGASGVADALPGNRAGVDSGAANALQTPTGVGPDTETLQGGLPVGPVPGASTVNPNGVSEALAAAAPKQSFDVSAATPWQALHDAGVPDGEIMQKIEDGLKASGADYVKHVGDAAGTDTYFGINNADGTLTSYDTASVLKAAGLTQ